jgi:5-methylthioadenosine/S-adenosylhomocysteine deaminase
MLASSGKTICLIGQVYDDQHGETLQTILIEDGKIKSMWSGEVPVPDLPGLIVIRLKPDEVLFPGFINLHVHTGYNIFPFWESPSNEWKNRFQWRNNAQYKRDIKDLSAYIKGHWQQPGAGPSLALIEALVASPANQKAYESFTGETLARVLPEVSKAHAIIGELQAVAGGTVLVQQTLELDQETADPWSFVIRNTQNPNDLGSIGSLQIISPVDFFRPVLPAPDVITGDPGQETASWTPGAQDAYRDFLTSATAEQPTRSATIAHLAEGRAGFLDKRGPDSYTRAEFAAFLESAVREAGRPPGLAKAHLLLTHATGLDTTDPDTLHFLRENNIGIVWSPVSNLLLYSDTLPVKALLDAGVNVCLGSDWSPSGSKHVWDELKFAKFLTDQLSLGISALDLYRMVTVNPAAGLGGLAGGRVREGFNADFFVLRKQTSAQPALEALFTLDDSFVQYVLVNGRVVYGQEEVFAGLLQVDYELLPASEGAHAAGKAISINKALGFNLQKSLQVMDLLVETYAHDTLQKDLKRPRFLASDDEPYQAQLQVLKARIRQLAAASPDELA